MTIYLRQSTASQEVLLPRMVDSTDGNTAETGMTIANTDIKIWKSGATTQASKNSGGATHISSGDYYCVLDATDTDTVGPLVITCHPTGALYTRVECMVLPSNVYDAWAGTDLLDVSVTQWTGTAVATPDTAGYPKVTIKDGTGTGELDTTSGGVLVAAVASGAITASAIASDAITAAKIADGAIDSGTFASGAITAAAIAADAIGASELATDAVTEIVDAVWAKTMTELSAVPGVTGTTLSALSWLFSLARNKVTQTSTTTTLFKDDGSTSLAASTVSDDGTTFTRGEFA